MVFSLFFCPNHFFPSKETCGSINVYNVSLLTATQIISAHFFRCFTWWMPWIIKTAWCFGTWILWLSIYIGNVIIPTDELTPSFFRGVGYTKPPTRVSGCAEELINIRVSSIGVWFERLPRWKADASSIREWVIAEWNNTRSTISANKQGGPEGNLRTSWRLIVMKVIQIIGTFSNHAWFPDSTQVLRWQ